MSYQNTLGIIFLFGILVIFGCVSFIKKDDDIVHGSVKYGRPLEIVGDQIEGMFHVIMVTKARLEDKCDHDVIYGVLEENFVYIRDAGEDILNNLVYGKFYECNVFRGASNEISHIELKGV